MSRFFRMEVAISDHVPQNIAAMQKAAEEEWPFEDWRECAGEWVSDGESNLCGGETDDEFAERLSKAVWRANGAFCKVAVRAFFLEELPVEDHCLGKADYERLIGQPEPT